MPNSQTLFTDLSNELRAIEEFCDLLTQEQEVLKTGDTEKLPLLIEEKHLLADKVNALTATRNQTLIALGASDQRQGIEHWCDQHPDATDIKAMWQTLLDTAAKAQNLNKLNGEIIRIRMQHTNNALDILFQKSERLDLYGPNGQSSTTGNRRINDAV